MKTLTNIALIILLPLLAFGCNKKQPAANPTDKAETVAENNQSASVPAAVVEVKDPAPQTTQDPKTPADPAPEEAATLPVAAPLKGLEWIKGGPVTTFEKGKIYVVEFWATWCGPCKVSIPHLTEIQKKFKDKGVIVIGISNEDPATVKPFVKNMGDQMDYNVAVDVQGQAQKDYMQAFNKNGIPQAFIINGNGKIVWEGHPLDNMDTVLDMVVKGDFDPAAYAKQKAEAEAEEKQVMGWYMEYFKTIEADGLTDKAKQIGADFIEKAPAEGLNAFAWNILTRVKEEDRDHQAALQAAQKANEQAEGKDPSILDTYAMALFEAGKVQEAIAAQQKAVDLAKDYPDAQKDMKERLKQYQDALGEQI